MNDLTRLWDTRHHSGCLKLDILAGVCKDQEMASLSSPESVPLLIATNGIAEDSINLASLLSK